MGLVVAGCSDSTPHQSAVRDLRILPSTSTTEAPAMEPPTTVTSTVVAGQSITTSTLAAPATLAPAPAPVKPAAPATTTTTRPKSVTSTTKATARTVPAPATTSTTRTPTTAAPASPSGRVDEHSDNGFTFTYSSDPNDRAAGSATTLDRSAPADRFAFTVSGGVDHGSVAIFKATVKNLTSKTITFPGGFDMRWIVTRDGVAWKTVHLTHPEITSLPAGAEVSGSAQAVMDAYGSYSFTGAVLVQYP